LIVLSMHRTLVLAASLAAFACALAPRAAAQAPAPGSVAMPSERTAPAPPSNVPAPSPRPLGLRLTLVPEWGYRSFRDNEPVGEAKRFTANGVPMMGARVELYPLAFDAGTTDGLKDLGLTFNYSSAFGLTARDVDTSTTVDTKWYQFGFGLRYRMLGGDNPLAIGLTLGMQRSVFDFEGIPASRPVAIGRYTLLPVGVDVRRSWGAFSLFGDARFLLPITISPPGNRTPEGLRYGASLALAAAMRITTFFELEARGSYALVGYSLPSGIVGSNRSASIYDEALSFSLGAAFLL
jgi:hypothetical protein